MYYLDFGKNMYLMFYGFESVQQEIQQLWNAKSGNIRHKTQFVLFENL
jgi:hypothetical protein